VVRTSARLERACVALEVGNIVGAAIADFDLVAELGAWACNARGCG
jgi:hypothetical protein